MLGKPKYKIGDKLKFQIHSSDGNDYWCEGVVEIVDAYGVFEDESDVHYDIMVEHSPLHADMPCLYKHLREDKISEKIA